MKRVLLYIFVLVVTGLCISFFVLQSHKNLASPLGILQPTPRPTPLMVYTFANLKKTVFPQSQITLGSKLAETQNSQSQVYFYNVPAKPNAANMLKVSGVLNVPKKPGTYPVIVMFRGFVPQETYQPGIGTEPSAKVFADHGFITIAPDFLGYGQSDIGADGFENRFQTYTTALTLLSSLQNLNSGLEASYSGKIKADMSKIGIWGHSNGGHIALSTLAISGVSYPTVLWAPVSKSFPYSILYYTDESDDQGKTLRKSLAEFEQDYDTDLFDPTKYYQDIKAPIEISQGTADVEVPVWWSDELVNTLKRNGNDVTYFTYPGADHNLLPNGWSQAVINSMNFYNKYFSK